MGVGEREIDERGKAQEKPERRESVLRNMSAVIDLREPTGSLGMGSHRELLPDPRRAIQENQSASVPSAVLRPQTRCV